MTNGCVLSENLSQETYDGLVHSTCAHRLVGNERPLFASKWFDYRFLHPTIATLRFAQAYEAAYHRFYARVIDRKRAEHVAAFSFPKVKVRGVEGRSRNVFDLSVTVRTSLWNGRQIADGLCIPYEFFVEFGFETVLKYWKNPSLPRPNHFLTATAIASIHDKWEERQKAELFTATHENYKVSRFVGTRDQLDHHDWLMLQASRRNRERAYSLYIERELMTREQIDERLSKSETSH